MYCNIFLVGYCKICSGNKQVFCYNVLEGDTLSDILNQGLTVGLYNLETCCQHLRQVITNIESVTKVYECVYESMKLSLEAGVIKNSGSLLTSSGQHDVLHDGRNLLVKQRS